MATKNVRNKSNKKKKNKFRIIGPARAILFLVAIILSLSFLTNGMGLVGDFLDELFILAFGNAALLIPLILIFIAINSYLNSIDTSDLGIVLSGVGILILFTLIFDLLSDYPGTFRENRIGGSSFNGGYTGGFLNYFLLKFFGEIGTGIFIAVIMAILLVLFFGVDYISVGKSIANSSKNSAKSLGEYIDNKSKERALNSKKSKEERLFRKDRERHSIEDNTSKEISTEPVKDDKIRFFFNGKEEDINSQSFYDEIDTDKAEILEEEKPKKVSKVSDRDKKLIEREIEVSEENRKPYEAPSIDFLKSSGNKSGVNRDEVYENSRTIEETMANFGIDAKVSQVNSGPSVTSYELVPAPNVKLSKIVSLSDNLAFSLASSGIRIEAPIPGKTAVGIEVPNKTKSMVTLRDVIDSREFKEYDGELPLVLGKDTKGDVIISSINEMPHLLIAGATGSGKSVCINSIIISILYKSSPDDVRLILIDPKMVELGNYNSIPHLLIPVVTNAKKAASTLAWAVEEMERRYKAFADSYVKDINSYNEKVPKEEKMPKIVIIIDELADLMMVASKEVEDYIARLAQMARAAGMHLVLATQRPSVDVITGTIKSNIPSRISFAVSSQIDSRTILDSSGAEKLLGKGDMLFFPSFYPKPKRLQGCFVSQSEIDKIIEFFDNREYDTTIDEDIVSEINNVDLSNTNDTDPLFMDALKIVVYDDQASISYLQRKLSIGYSRAARIIDSFEERGFIGPSKGSKPRDVIISEEEYLELLGEDFE